MVAFVFFRIILSVRSLEQKIKQNGARFSFVAWCMVNTRSKNPVFFTVWFYLSVRCGAVRFLPS